MHIPKRWMLLSHDTSATDRLAKTLGIVPALAQLLLNRGVHTPDQAKAFLHPSLNSLHDPSSLPGITEAAERIHQAALDRKRICIYGDYDVDGITASTILWRCLTIAGADVDYYVPDRIEEGYGLNSEALRKLKEQNFQLVVTVDCGITSVEQAKVARKLGLELIVTDHHEMKDELPDATVLVHPRLPGSEYPFKELCGAGVAFKLAWAIAQKFSNAQKVSENFKNFLVESIALVALGTVADVVPLIGENRIFVRQGLKSLQSAPSIGLKALIQAAELGEKELDAGHIGFTLAPRLNAAGRLGQARLAIELLATSHTTRAVDLARYLNDQNEKRQTVERRITSQAKELIEAMGEQADTPAYVLSSDEWHPGVIGIVASRLVDKYARPVLMISTQEEVGSGSGRSIDGFALHEALAACNQHLLSHGGHAMAAGFKVAKENIEALRSAFIEHAGKKLDGRTLQHTLNIDAEISLSALTMGLLKGIAALAPHGSGNRRPLFLASGLQVVGEPKKVGKGENHLSFRVKQSSGPTIKAIAWGMGDRVEELLSQSGQCSLVFTPKPNEWNGYTSIDMEVADLQAGGVAKLQ
ncbi:MAG: single-stranded-DNA-specific exonuclease RecJ [Gemmatales bacterium]